MCSGSVVVAAYHSESGRPGSNPEWGLIYYKASITAQGLPEPSSLRDSILGTRAAEHKGCNWGMQVDWRFQPCAVFGHSFSGISWHMPQKWSKFNCMTLSKCSAITLHYITLHYNRLSPYTTFIVGRHKLTSAIDSKLIASMFNTANLLYIHWISNMMLLLYYHSSRFIPVVV